MNAENREPDPHTNVSASRDDAPQGEPVVTGSPSSHQPRSAPPAGSEPQGRITMIAAVVAIVVIAIIVIVVLF